MKTPHDKDARTTSPAKAAALRSLIRQVPGTAGGTQCNRLLAAFQRVGVLTTYEARTYLDILDPPSRVRDLRADGVPIVTLWRWIVTDAGVRHRVGQYTLLKGKSAKKPDGTNAARRTRNNELRAA